MFSPMEIQQGKSNNTIFESEIVDILWAVYDYVCKLNWKVQNKAESKTVSNF